MENTNYNILNRLNYLEFRQNLLILKQPCHKVSVFFDLNIDIFTKIKNFSNDFCKRIQDGENLTLKDYEKSLNNIWPPISSYPSSHTLIAQALLDKKIFELITK